MIQIKNIENWPEFLNEVKAMTKQNLIKNYGREWLPMWKGLQTAKAGEVVIRIVEGGNEYMKVGDSKCGMTPGIQVEVPIVIEQPNGSWYKGGTIESIDWENETFRTSQSTYSFHFVKS